MAHWFVRMKSPLTGNHYPAVWYDRDADPKQSPEFKSQITQTNILTDADIAAFDQESSGFNRGVLTLVEWCDKRFPAPVEAET